MQASPQPQPTHRLTSLFATDDEGIDPFAGIDRDVVAEFFDRTRVFVLAHPWDAIPEGVPIGVDVPELGTGLVGGCAVLLGDARGPRAIALFPSYAGYEAFVEAILRAEESGALARCDLGTSAIVVDFYAKHELCDAAVARVERDALRHATPDSIPVPDVLDEHGVSLPLCASDLRLLSVVLTAIANLCLFHRERLDGEAVVQAIVEPHGLPLGVIDFPHPEWRIQSIGSGTSEPRVRKPG